VSVILAIFAIVLPLVLRRLKINPYKPNETKNDTYECGMETSGRSWVQFNFRYYVYALMLIAMDVLAIFLYPWAVEIKTLGFFGFLVISFFILLIIVGYTHAWKKRALEWQ
jgi:NADH-quinone oxidoreductase subunit A